MSLSVPIMKSKRLKGLRIMKALMLTSLMLVLFRIGMASILSAPRSMLSSLEQTYTDAANALLAGNWGTFTKAVLVPPLGVKSGSAISQQDNQLYNSVWPSDLYTMVPAPYLSADAFVAELNRLVVSKPGYHLEALNLMYKDRQNWIASGRWKLGAERQVFAYYQVPHELWLAVATQMQPEDAVLANIAAWKAEVPERAVATIEYTVTFPHPDLFRVNHVEEEFTPVGFLFLFQLPDQRQ